MIVALSRLGKRAEIKIKIPNKLAKVSSRLVVSALFDDAASPVVT